MKELPGYREHLIQLLKAEISSASDLLELLKTEREKITSFDDKLIQLTTTKKEQLITLLQDASNSRVNYMTLHNITNPIILNEKNESRENKADTQASSAHNELKMLFHKLTLVARECYEENRLIGQLINRHSQFISNAITSMSPSISSKNSSANASLTSSLNTTSQSALTYEENGNFVNNAEGSSRHFQLAKI